MVNSSAATPRRVATIAKGGVVVGAGLALAVVTGQINQSHLVFKADGAHVLRHSESDDSVGTGRERDDGPTGSVIAYRSKSGSGYAAGSLAPGSALQPAPANAVPAATSTAS